MSAATDQTRIWEYYQGQADEVFDGSVPRLRFLLRRARRFRLPPGARVLNIGVGNGWLERACVDAGWRVASLDPTEAGLRRLSGTAVRGTAGVIEAMPYAAGAFDAVFCSEVLEHLEPVQAEHGLREIARVLRRGGLLIGTVPYREDLAAARTVCPECGCVFHRWGHRQSFDGPRLRALLSGCGFQVLTAAPRAFPHFAQATWQNRLKAVAVRALGRAGLSLAFPVLTFVSHKS